MALQFSGVESTVGFKFSSKFQECQNVLAKYNQIFLQYVRKFAIVQIFKQKAWFGVFAKGL